MYVAVAGEKWVIYTAVLGHKVISKIEIAPHQNEMTFGSWNAMDFVLSLMNLDSSVWFNLI